MRHADVRHVLDTRLAPIIVWQVDGAPIDGDIDLLPADCFVVVDARSATPPSPAQLARLRAIAASARGVALVLPSLPLRRAILQMTAWRTLPPPHVLCPHMAAAMLWAEAQLLRDKLRACA